MSKSAAQKRIATLRKDLERHNRLYYADNKPELSDREFDGLLKELQDLETQFPDLITSDSPTQRVGGEPLKGFASVTHRQPMMSLDNTYNVDELREFDQRVRKLLPGESVEYVLEPKIDGASISRTSPRTIRLPHSATDIFPDTRERIATGSTTRSETENPSGTFASRASKSRGRAARLLIGRPPRPRAVT